MDYPVASKGNVADYLVKVYGLKAGVVAEILAEDSEKWREMAKGIEYRSHAQYVGDRIVEHAGLANHYSDERFAEYAAPYEADDDE